MNRKKICTLGFMMLVLISARTQQNSGAIKGKITAADNKAAEGVTVLMKNTSGMLLQTTVGHSGLKMLWPANIRCWLA